MPQISASSEPSTYALSFDGVNDRVEIADVPNLRPTELTVSFWLNITTLKDLACWMSKSWDGDNETWRILMRQIAELNFFHVWMSNTSTSATIEAFYPMEVGTWYFVVFTYDGAEGELFVNAVSLGTTEWDTLYYGAYPVQLGRNLGGGEPYSNAILDEVRIYNRALNSTEISYAYNSGMGTYAPLNSTGLVAWCKFDEGSSSTLYDRSGNDNHGTIEGATWVSDGIAPDWYSIDELYLQVNYIGTLSSQSFSSDTLTFNVSASSGTSTTKVYCAPKGQPIKVEGADDWTWDPSGILTLTVDHTSSKSISISWRGGAEGSYRLRVHVTQNKLPYFGASVSVDGENKTTDLLGDAYFDVGYGYHDITVVCGDLNETREILVSADHSVGFNFEYHAPKDRSIYILIGVPLGFLIIVLIVIVIWKKR